VTTTYWVPTIGNVVPPLPASQGGTGSANGVPFWIPGDDGFLGANSEAGTASGGGLLTAGTLYLARLNIRAATTITNLFFCVSTVGVGASTGSFVGLYSAAGTLLTGSADVGGTFAGTTGWKSQALTSPQAFAAGAAPYAAVLCNLATTQVTLLRQDNSANAISQAVVNPATQRWGSFAAQGTALPASVTMSAMAASAFTNMFAWT
jgi:hypothetical protein